MITARLQRMRENTDGGFALIYVMMVTIIVTLLVAASLSTTYPDILGSKKGQDTSAALIAAESGIQDAIAYLTSTPACDSETRICPQALGTNSTKLNRTTKLSATQTFYWSTNASQTADGYVRVTSTGTEAGTSKTLVADLALNPSILKYGYYSNYESQSPTFISTYDGARTIDITNSTDYSQIPSSTRGSASSPNTVTWNGAAVSPPSGYSDSICGQHWYYDSASSPGRAAALAAQQKIANNPSTIQSMWAETGLVKGSSNSATHYGTCDLVFTAGMVENGMTYSRDAFAIANGSGSGPTFNQPVYTGWGYGTNTTPTAPSSPWRQFDGTGKDTLSGSPYKPATATQDITLPTSIGTAGIETNSCVYYGPTRVLLNGDGTATITSPETTAAVSGADAGCYPTTAFPNGIVNFTYNYTANGAGTIYVKNLNTPTSGVWPTTTLKSTSTPSASNTVFYIPDTKSTVTADPSTSAAPSSACTSSNTYSASTNATCAWTNIGTTASSSAGWTAYNSSTACKNVTTVADEQNFQCEYNHLASNSSSTPSTDGYAALRTTLQNQLAAGTCVSGTIATQQSCIVGALNTALATANTSQHAYNYSSPASGDHQYYAVATGTGTVGTATSNLSPTPGDSLFTFTGTPGQEKGTSTPMNFTVYRQTYSGGKWGTGTAQFTFTVVHTDWVVTSQPNGYDYFPNVNDITPYAMGSNSSSAAVGTTGTSQPGDLYVQGTNQGALSLIAQNNVELTGNVLESSGDTSTANPISITAGNDIRNYHPVSCTDTTAADINATSAGWCPNDLTGLVSYTTALSDSSGNFYSWAPQSQYANLTATGTRTIDAVLFALSGSLRTDNYDRAPYVGSLVVNGGVYQDFRGGNGFQSGSGSAIARTGTSLNYNYVDLERGNLQYVPSALYSSNPRVWNVVSTSDGTNPAGS